MNTCNSKAEQISNKNAVAIISAKGISFFGAFLNMVALPTYVYALTEDVMHLSLYLAMRVAGGVFASSIGTLFFKRFVGRFSFVGFDILRALLLASLFIIPEQQQIYVLPFIAFGLGVGNGMFAIGINTQIPYLVTDEKRIFVNGWLTSISSTAAVAGSLTSGVVIATGGYDAVLLLNIVTYLLAGAIIMSIELLRKPDYKLDTKESEWKKLRNALSHNKILACLMMITLADTLGSSAHNVGFPILSKLLTPEDAGMTMGIILATWAIGKFGGSRLISVLLKSNDSLAMERYFMIGVLMMSAGFILLFSQSTLLWLIPMAILAGIGDGIAEVSLMSRIQNEDDATRLPLFSLMAFMQNTGFGIGMLIVAPFFVWWSPMYVVMLFHGLPILTVLMVLFTMRNRLLKS